MCATPIKIKYNDRYKKYRGSVIHAYNTHQILPCGKCYHCRELKIEEWQIRWAEQLKISLPNTSYLLTLTYNDKNLPTIITPDGEIKSTLDYTHVQKFMKRLRKRQEKLCKLNNIENPKISYHGCGEYGTKFTKRPHYHILITNLIVPPDEIEKIWSHGKIHIGDQVNEKTIKYVLKYTLKNTQNHKQKTKIYTSDIIKFTTKAFPDEQHLQPLYKKLNISHYNPDTNPITIEKNKVKQFEIYNLNEINEYRIAEKTFCSKGIGKNFITPEVIAEYHRKPSMNFIYYDTQKESYKVKPLPRYYREIIFNPKKKCPLTGKLLKDENGKYIQLWSPLQPNYEKSPRFKKQVIQFQNMQNSINKTMEEIKLVGYKKYYEIQKHNKESHYQAFKRKKDLAEQLQQDRNYKAGLAHII